MNRAARGDRDAVGPAGPVRPPAPSGRLEGLRPYAPQPAERGIDLRLDANEGVEPAAAVLDSLRSVSAEDVRRYPDASSLERVIAGRLGVDPARVVVTNGGDDAIDRVCRALLDPGREMVTHTPGFVMIPRSARLAGASVRTVEWTRGPFPAQDFTGALSGRTALVALVSPNNPTGGVIDADTMVGLVRAAGGIGAAALIDLAYIEFADADPTSRLLAEPNAVLIRTMSKAMGLAGARVGYAVAPPQIASWLRTVGAPFPVSSVSLSLAARALDRVGEREGFVAAVRGQRESLAGLLRELGGDPIDSQANFVMVFFRDAAFVHAALGAMGILVRSFGAEPCEPGPLRITVPGVPADFDRLCASLRTILAPRGVILDVRGQGVAAVERLLVPSAVDSLRRRTRVALLADPNETNDRSHLELGVDSLTDASIRGAAEGAWMLCLTERAALDARALGCLPVGLGDSTGLPLRVSCLEQLKDMLP